ncbi:MAG: amidase [Pseudomonadota bacterium]
MSPSGKTLAQHRESPDSDALCYMSAAELVDMQLRKAVSSREILEAFLDRISRCNPSVNAIVTLDAERAFDAARRCDAAMAAGRPLGVLHGLPVAHKDLFPTEGMRTTWGSLARADTIPQVSALHILRLRAEGAISIGKTNTPEFGAGSQTFNEVFGTTLNPYDAGKTSGGSSGGAAAALASGMVALADGSDMGGSLRNPAAFCNVVGLRPTPGTVPTWPNELPWSTLSVDGPMARSASDTARMLSAMAGPDPRSPISRQLPGDRFRQPIERDFAGTKIAFSPDFARLMPIEPAITGAVDACAVHFASFGCKLVSACPAFDGADRVFKTERAWIYSSLYGHLLERNRDLLKQTVVWNIEQGENLTGADLAAARRKRAALWHEMVGFMAEHEYLVVPTTQVLPFSADVEYPEEIQGVPMESYIDWMQSCYFISVTGHPAASVPCGFSDEGLPIGLQIVGRYGDDFGVLQLAHAFERVSRFGARRPDQS